MGQNQRNFPEDFNRALFKYFYQSIQIVEEMEHLGSWVKVQP